MRILLLVLSLLCLLIIPVYSISQNSLHCDTILGTWLNEDKNISVKVYKTDTGYGGRLNWIKNPYDKHGKIMLDFMNPDQKLKTRSRVGLVVVKDLLYTDEGKYEFGKVYDPRTGKTHACVAYLEGSNLLKLRGYIGIKLLGRTSEWTRAD